MIIIKKINDTHGHAKGDLALINLVKMVNQEIHKIDIFGRNVGEEFALILPDCIIKSAGVTTERIRSAFTNQIDMGVDYIPFTASFGISQLLPDDNSLDNILSRADKALYQSRIT
jgi:diguanylate cyclase (GGDEF)-like protein